MTALQKIAMGVVVVLLPANFPRDPDPYWRFYDALPDPLGWALVISGVWTLSHTLDVDLARWLAVLALLISVPLWFPEISHHLLPRQGAGAEPTDLEVTPYQWFASLPHVGFCLVLVRTIGRGALAQSPPDRFVAGRFGVLTWGFIAAAVLPAVAFGGRVAGLQAPSLLLLALVDIVFVYYLFRVHGRTWLGGTTKAAPDEPERPA